MCESQSNTEVLQLRLITMMIRIGFRELDLVVSIQGLPESFELQHKVVTSCRAHFKPTSANCFT